MIRELFGIDLGPNRANALALVTLTAVAAISILLNIRDRRGARPPTGTESSN
jgi:hypothetical protein